MAGYYDLYHDGTTQPSTTGTSHPVTSYCKVEGGALVFTDPYGDSSGVTVTVLPEGGEAHLGHWVADASFRGTVEIAGGILYVPLSVVIKGSAKLSMGGGTINGDVRLVLAGSSTVSISGGSVNGNLIADERDRSHNSDANKVHLSCTLSGDLVSPTFGFSGDVALVEIGGGWIGGQLLSDLPEDVEVGGHTWSRDGDGHWWCDYVWEDADGRLHFEDPFGDSAGMTITTPDTVSASEVVDDGFLGTVVCNGVTVLPSRRAILADATWGAPGAMKALHAHPLEWSKSGTYTFWEDGWGK